jgi:hypothetical protein
MPSFSKSASDEKKDFSALPLSIRKKTENGGNGDGEIRHVNSREGAAATLTQE